MEIHTHPHSKTHSKGWKEYISEFLMLFLAVFCGFIAENLREHYVEKAREKEYIVSMVNDLKRDSFQLRRIKEANLQVIKGIDTLLTYLKADSNGSITKKIYVYARYGMRSILYEESNGTMSQLKNAGGYRLIKDTAAVGKIADYDQVNALLTKQGDAYYKQTLDLIELFTQLLDFSISKPIMGKRKNAHPYFIKNDADRLRVLYNKCLLQQSLIGQYCNLISYQRQEADTLINLLNKNYHLAAFHDTDKTNHTIDSPKKKSLPSYKK